MIIPINEIAHETLVNLIEGFVLQEGTEYGAEDVSLADKVAKVLAQLKSGEAYVVYSELHETVNIVPKNQLKHSESED
ncbi:YheU family protein [Paraglaciecola sp.]|uniref:YheU family protein n=1 Tax=Paraglaciecola sp. TaxID=1920173 RepID=UPI0030F3D3F1